MRLTQEIVRLALVAAALALATITISDSSIFGGFREYWKLRNKRIFKLLSCRYCLSHWTAATAVVTGAADVVHVTAPWASWLVTWLLLTWLINVLAGVLIKVNE